jgi:hypothetical protein
MQGKYSLNPSRYLHSIVKSDAVLLSSIIASQSIKVE